VTAPEDLLKISELARRSGVSVGTIRFYIREGLLPRPTVKTSRNMAYYDESFVSRIRLVRRLQEERRLPLSMIRSIVSGGDEDHDAVPSLVELEAKAAAALEAEEHGEEIGERELIERTGITRDDLDELRALELITTRGTARAPRYAAVDVAIVEAIARARALGLTRELFPTRPLRIARDGLARCNLIARTLLGEEERSFIFQRYLEHVIPEDTARSRFARATSAQETPEDSLVAIRHGFTNAIEVCDALLRQDRVSFRTFYAVLGIVQREVARNSFFNPIRALEFRPEFDRLKSPEVFELVQSVPGDEAHRLVALAILSLFRILRYLSLIDAITNSGHPTRALLVLAALRSDGRALTSHLRRHAGALLSEGYERELFSIGARGLTNKYEALLAEGHRLLGIKGALEGIAAKLRLELRRAFERELPSVEAPTSKTELEGRLRTVTQALRPAVQSTILFLCKALGARLDVHFVFDDLAAKREVGERLRRDVWMFAQIVRGFAAKAAVVRTTPEKSDRWASVEGFRFVKEFLAYFRAMGYPLLRANDYPRFDQFIAAMNSLEETDLLDPSRLQNAVAECEAFYTFLVEVFESIGRREELAGTPFDRRAAAEALRLYLGEIR